MKRGLVLGLLIGSFSGCSTPPLTAQAPDPGVVLASKLLAETSLENRLRMGIDARLGLGIGFGYSVALREKGKTKFFALGKKTFEPVKLLGVNDALALGSLIKRVPVIRKKRREIAPGYSLNADRVLERESSQTASAAEMGKFLEVLEKSPASIETELEWDSPPGAKILWKSEATASHSMILAFDRESKRAVYVGTNSLARPDGLVFGALGSTQLDPLVALATPKRSVSEEDITRLKGSYQSPNCEVEIFEVFGRLSIRYQQKGGLLIPDSDSKDFNIIDGTHNLDQVRLLSDGVRITRREGEKSISFECAKIEKHPEQYPAQE